MIEGLKGIVLGAGSGVGKAISISLARNGASLYLGARSEALLEKTAARIRAEQGVMPPYHVVDASEWTSISNFADLAASRLGSIDFLVSVVFGHIGEDRGLSLEEVNPNELEVFLKDSVLSNWFLLKALTPYLRKNNGRFILIVADWGFPQHNVFTGVKNENDSLGSEAFVSAKYAQHGLVVAAERMLQGVSTCGIYPGVIAAKKSESGEDIDIDDPSLIIESDPDYANGRAIILNDICEAVKFCLSIKAVPKAVLLKPPAREYDGGLPIK